MEEADAVVRVYVWHKSQSYTVHPPSFVTGSVLMKRLRLFLGQFTRTVPRAEKRSLLVSVP